ncbi:MAG: YfhO family protein, partial [Anaerolineales bacterium]|nr:YfhO family protein [Anaerolineales bacterium]MDW8448119.1 YfhO family protein [Anaerolineales bacterium]
MDGKFAVSLLAALALWGGLIAVHFLPMLQFRPYISKGLDVLGSHTPLQIWLDYTSKDTFRQDAYSVLPAREEYYAYIGYVPFAALLLLPFGWKRGRRRWIFYWVMVLIFVVLWIDLDRMPWRDAYYRTYLWSQFRYVIRPLIFGSLAILLLGAFGIDAVWKGFVYEMQCDGAQGSNKLKRLISSFGVLGLSALMFLGVFDTLWTNSKHLLLQEDNLTAYRIVRWMREHDSSEYYVRHNPVGSWHLAMLSSQVRFIDAWYHWMDIRRIDAAERLNRRPVQARPHYVIQSVDAPPPEGRLQLIYQMDGTVIYKVLDSLPIAFKVNEQTLLANSDAELSKEEVEPLTPLFVKTDAVEIIAHGSAKDVLVVLVTHYPGWQVQVDGRKAKLESVSGYLAVRMREGIHKYRFEFRPTVFYLGLLISLMSFGIGLFVIRSEVAAWLWKVKSLMFELRDFWGRIKDQANRWGQTQSVFNPAVFHRGAFLLRSNATFEEGYEADLVVLPKRDNKTQVPVLWAAWKQVTWLLIRSSLSEVSLPSILFAFALLIYLGMRTVRLADFPIYFFTDEAIQTASAAELVRDGFYGPGRVFLPTYFPNGSYWNLSVSVYVQVIPYLLFGKSVFVTRFTSLLLSGLLILILVSALRQTICPRAWWSLLLFLAVTPTWFLHSRTAFETVLFCGFYAGFLGAYLLYIQRSPKYLYLAILMAALGFYTYSPGQVILAVTAVALFALDFRYHWQNRSYLGKGFWLILLLAIPYFRFLSYHQEAPFQHLRNLDSYWFYDLPLVAKIWRYVRE